MARFRTDQPDGVLVYSRGAQGDLLVIQLVENRLKITARLGGWPPPLRNAAVTRRGCGGATVSLRKLSVE